MSFHAVAQKTATISSTATFLSSTSFNFASSDLAGAQRVTILPTSASLRIGWAGVAPTTAAGIPVTSGSTYNLTGVVNVANLQMIAQTTSASVIAIIEK